MLSNMFIDFTESKNCQQRLIAALAAGIVKPKA
jgi:hypothetical protein